MLEFESIFFVFDKMLLCARHEHRYTADKKDLSLLLEKASAGDTIITTEVSRLSRSTKQLCEIIDTIQRKRLKLEIMGSITIDCRSGQFDPMTKAFLQMSGIFAELELSMMIYSRLPGTNRNILEHIAPH